MTIERIINSEREALDERQTAAVLKRMHEASAAKKARRAAQFAVWMNHVDIILSARVGLSADDLPDVGYADLFDAGLSAAAAAAKAIRAAHDE